jgi:DNA-binding transcriptional ArsR family regulator
MRPPAEPQSALRNPLNDVLGREAHVRILRVLGAAEAPIGKAELARQADLNPSGVRRALGVLIELGIVEEVGKTPRPPVRLRKKHSLSGVLRDLYRAERARFDLLVESLREMVSRVRPPPRSAWVQGPVARGTDKPGDPVLVGVLTSARNAASAREQLLSMLPKFVSDPDVQVVLKTCTLADMNASTELEEELQGAILLVAPHPLQLLDSRRAAGDMATGYLHSHMDRQALALARAIADRIPKDPELIPRAVSYLRRRMEQASARERPELNEWLDLLETKSVAQVRSLLLDPGERATRLRQSLPFLEVLTETERIELLQRVNDDAR